MASSIISVSMKENGIFFPPKNFSLYLNYFWPEYIWMYEALSHTRQIYVLSATF